MINSTSHKLLVVFIVTIISAEVFSEMKIGSPLEITGGGTDSESVSVVVLQDTICLSEINSARGNNGKGSVSAHSQVEQAAYNHNVWMVRNNCFSHQCSGEPPVGDRLSSTGYRWSGVGEILAAGSGDCPGAIQQWLNSPGHRSIMLGDYNHVGCSGLLCNNCDYGTYWTCVFANN